VVNLQLGDAVTIGGSRYTLEGWGNGTGTLIGRREHPQGVWSPDVLPADARPGAVARGNAVIGRIVGSNFHPA